MRQDSFRHILKSSASMYESSGSQFFKTTTNIQSGPDAFDESRLVITFLTTLGITEILCSFRLVLEKKAGKETLQRVSSRSVKRVFTIRVVRKIFSKQKNTYRPLNRGGITYLLLLRTLLVICQKSQEPSSW